MRRFATLVLVALLLPACSSTLNSAQQSAHAKVQRFLANKFSQKLLGGIDLVINQLAAEGGYLDDPLVRILLPPPLGIAIGVARDLQHNPQAALLETLINQAAEHSIPLAGPFLKTVLTDMDTPSIENILSSGGTAATDYLKSKGSDAIEAALLPAVSSQLEGSGAIALYGQLLSIQNTAEQLHSVQSSGERPGISTTQVVPATDPAPVAPEQLGQYVTEQAMSGLFTRMAKQELQIRQSLTPSITVPL